MKSICQSCIKCTLRNIRVLMLGLDGAGKSSLVYQWKLQKYLNTIPRMGLTVETIHCPQSDIHIYDVSGKPKMRALWRYYAQDSDIMVFVIDSTQRDFKMIYQTKEELSNLMNYRGLANVPFLVLFSKSDLPNSMTDEEIEEEYGVTIGEQFIKAEYNHKIMVMKTTALTSNNQNEVLDWMQVASSEQI
ncbi:ADP-ribosylation_factor 1 [Hexamita inflata]|uniref:ADP-ribosylation factor 1 n=1 Tax=Hexamita inflata TaxID=28002 RepID=A0AA86NSW7_9EUKA|nr:ADP-ribosylation factor 1 [Hexamita inflata]